MSFEIQASAPSAFQFNPQVGANETIAGGDIWNINGGNTAIQTSNGGVDTLNISLILDGVTGGNLASVTANGLYVSPSNATASSITDTVDAVSLLGLNGSGVPTRWNLTDKLIPFGTAGGGWGADTQLGFDQPTNTLFSGVLRTTTPPSPGTPTLAFIEDATGEVGKFDIDAGNIILGLGAGAGITQFAPSCTPSVRSVAGLGMNAATSQFDNVLFREKLAARSVSANTTLNPANDDVIVVNNSSGNVTVTLTAPASCEPSIFHVKQANSNTTNSITLTPASGQIDGAATHVFGNSNSAVRESRMIYHDGTNWHVL